MTLNANALFAFNDMVRKGSIYSVACPTVAGAPASNMLLEDLWQPVIFAPTVAQPTVSFVIDLGSPRSLNLIALLKHNVNYTGKWRVQLNYSISDPVGQEYDSGYVNVIPSIPSYGAQPWGTFIWNDAIPEFNLGKFNRHAYLPLPDLVVARYITVTFDSVGNTSPIKFFRLWASEGYQPSSNIIYGASIQVEDSTKMTEAVEGTRTYGTVVQQRILAAGFDMLPRAEMIYNIVGGMYLGSGIKETMIFLMEPTDPSSFFANAVFGNLQPLDKATFNSWGVWDTTFSIKEAV